MEISDQLHDPSRFTTGQGAPGTHWTGVWVGLTAGLDGVAELLHGVAMTFPK